MALAMTSPQAATRDTLEQQRDLLSQRLDIGYRRIDDAARAGRDVSEWEHLWISLLYEYEAVCQVLSQRN